MRTAETTRHPGIMPAGIPIEDRLARYTTDDFLEDQRHLLQSLGIRGEFADRVEELDGRYLVLHPALARLDAREANTALSERFDPDTATRRVARFLALSRFLHERRDEIVGSGLSSADAALSVREELVRFLIAHYGQTIPTIGLARFLDEWGHRWI